MLTRRAFLKKLGATLLAATVIKALPSKRPQPEQKIEYNAAIDWGLAEGVEVVSVADLSDQSFTIECWFTEDVGGTWERVSPEEFIELQSEIENHPRWALAPISPSLSAWGQNWDDA